MQVCKFSITNINVSLGVSQQRKLEFSACQMQPYNHNKAFTKQLNPIHSMLPFIQNSPFPSLPFNEIQFRVTWKNKLDKSHAHNRLHFAWSFTVYRTFLHTSWYLLPIGRWLRPGFGARSIWTQIPPTPSLIYYPQDPWLP